MKRWLYLLIAICGNLHFNAFAQEPVVQWLRGYNGNSAVDRWVSRSPDGGVIINIQGTDTGLDYACTNGGNVDVFYKLSADASTVLWSKCYRGNFGDSAFMYLFELPGGNNVFGATSMGSNHQFLLRKEDAAGTLIWRKTYGNGAEAILDEMMPAADGGYVLAGRVFFTDTTFTIHHGLFDQGDMAVLRVDSNGNKMWSQVVGGTGDEWVGSVVAAPGDGSYVVGTEASTDGDFTGINHGGSDCFIIRYDASGNIAWKKCLGGTGAESRATAVANGKGGLILSGHYISGDGDRTHYPAYGCPVWIAEIDSSGNIVWDNCYGGGTGGNCYPNTICKAADGSIWMAGVSATAGVYVGIQYGRDDAWFLHIDSAGNYINSRVMGSSYQDAGTMIFPLSNGNILAGGYYDTLSGTFAGMNTHSTWPYGSAFLTVFSPQTDGVTSITKAAHGRLNVYPNPAKNTLHITSDEIIETLAVYNALGQRVYLSTPREKELIIHSSDLPCGLYLVSANNAITAKFEKR